jgi:hypothetical protein
VPEGVSLADGLSEDEAVALALWRNLDLEAKSVRDVEDARAELAAAESAAKALPPAGDAALRRRSA